MDPAPVPTPRFRELVIGQGRLRRAADSKAMLSFPRTKIAILAGLALVLAAGCSAGPKKTGVLRGHVSIGPLVPVVREGQPEPTPAPEVYAARQIVIYSEDGRKELARAEIDARGLYQLELPVGTYLVDINRIGIDSAAGLPAEVQIHAGEVTELDIDIDTGIR